MTRKLAQPDNIDPSDPFIKHLETEERRRFRIQHLIVKLRSQKAAPPMSVKTSYKPSKA